MIVVAIPIKLYSNHLELLHRKHFFRILKRDIYEDVIVAVLSGFFPSAPYNITVQYNLIIEMSISILTNTLFRLIRYYAL